MRSRGAVKIHPAWAIGVVAVLTLVGTWRLAVAGEAPRSGRHAVADTTTLAQVVRGRQMVIEHGCGGCHGGGDDPSSPNWLSGARTPADEFLIGPCAQQPGATPCFRTRPRNLTPDNATGLGRFTERQIFNALRFGLRPGETPDVEITSSTPGQGNFPENPKYLAPPMPWTEWRHMSDQTLWDIAAYLKHGVRPVNHHVEDSEGPPDFWAGVYAADQMGPFPARPFPTAQEEYRP